MKLDTDIIVVGCGAAGASAAETAASLGSRVLLLEEHGQVGIPSHCSGHVGIKAMKRLGVSLPDQIIKNQIRGAVIRSPAGQALRLERPSPITWVLDRKSFDEHLANRAEKAGAQIRFNSRATTLLTPDEGPVQVRVSSGDKSSIINCQLIIDCEGASPTLTRARPANEYGRSMWVNSAQVHVDHVKDLDHEMVEVYLGSSYAPGFFAWIIPWRDGSARIGLATREGNPRLFLERLMTRHPNVSRRLRNQRRRDISFHPIPLGGPIPKTFRQGMLIAGDSAQQVKPTTGGGIVFSLICGRIAGEIAHSASEARDASESSLSEYEKRWKSEIGRELDIMRCIRRMIFGLPDLQLDRIFSIARTLDIATVLSRADDIDLQGRALTKLGLDPRLMISMLYSSVLSIPFLGGSGQASARRSTAHKT